MSVNKLETALDEALNKKAPVQLPANGRKALARNLWWIALVIGIFELWAVYALWHVGHWADRFVDYANSVSAYYGLQTAATPHLGPFYYLSLLAMAAVAVLFLVAAPALKAMKKSGWNLLFYSLIIEAAVAILRLFSNVGGGFGNFVGAALSAVLGAYLLFQVREYFLGAKHVPAAAADKPEHHTGHAAPSEKKE